MAASAHAPAPMNDSELERRAFLDLLRMANTMVRPEVIARQLVVLARHLSGCEAVAIRLKVGPGFPYGASLGFPERFLALEDNLCVTDEQGCLLRDDHRKPLLACLCGRVLTGQVERALPFFTDRGSFITPSTSDLLVGPETQLLGKTRNRCHLAGYETVGLFPIRRDEVTYGLIQCNDPRPGQLPPQAVDLLENLATTAAHLFQLAMA
ncbi:MAG TPA: GAF domain-containing protein [Geothrix sp.]